MTTEEDGLSNKNENTTQTNTTDTNTITMDNQYFYEDLIYKINDKKVCFGMVIDNYEDNDSDSDQDEFNTQPLTKGSIKVSWYPHGYEQVVKERTVGLADRSLMPGDVVRRLETTKSSDSQHGYCREITVYADVYQVKTKNVLPSVPNSRLVPLDRYELDLVACLGPWVGSVKEHRTELTIAMMSCNPLSLVANVIGRFQLTHNNVCNLKPIEKRRWSVNYGACEHFIGQILIVKPCELKQVQWMTGAKELLASKKRHYLIIEDLKTVAVGVRWHCQGLTENLQETVPPQPEYLVIGDALKSLKMLNVFETCTSQIGDRHYLTVNENDTFETKSKWLKRQTKYFRNKENNTTNLSVDNNVNNLKVPTDGTPQAIMVEENITDSIGHDLVDDEEWSTEDESESSSVLTNSASSGRITPSPILGKKSPVLATKVLKKKMKKDRKLRPPSTKQSVTADTAPPKPGYPILVETLCTTSIATVVWQDGTIEKNISSTKLYPIHHLDDQEFFPGDFVIKNNNSLSGGPDSLQPDLRDYGVVQYMNHAARTALVKWFRTYATVSNTNCDDASPSVHGENEVSVYDLKDHPDFNFRPGTVVIRVAGCTNAQAAAGQVLDNFPEGRISVKWVDGSQSMCWPQDLYRVGDYDSDEGELWDDDDDDDDEIDVQIESLDVTHDASWETQSEESVPCGDNNTEASTPAGNSTLHYRLAANIERSCDAMARLENMFTQDPALQGRDVMRRLLDVYKDCRYLDRLMGTSIFHENYFTALLERAKVRDARPTVTQKIQRHLQRLFSSDDPSPLQSPENQHPTSENNLDDSVSTKCSQTTETNPVANNNDSSITVGIKSENIITNTKMAQKQAEAEQFLRENTAESTATNWKCVGSDSTITSIAKTAEILTNICNVQDSVKIAFEKDKNESSTSSPSEKVTPNNNVPLVSSPAEMSINLLKESGDKTIKTLYLRDIQTSNKIAATPSRITNSPTTVSSPSTVQTSAQTSSLTPLSSNEINNLNAGKALCSLIKSRLIIAHAEVLKRLGTANFIHKLRNEDELSEEDKKTPVKTVECAVETPIKSPMEESISITSNMSSSQDFQDQNVKEGEGFVVLEVAPTNHKYHLSIVQPTTPQPWINAVRREFKLLGRALPPGVWVRAYEDRLDILSVMIRGPADTPYEDGLFLFDIQLGVNYPLNPPLFHYISYCSDRLNPNLYEDGKVCVSLLGTWSGRGSEIWGPDSTLLQVIVSIQGLILNAEPYYNEAGYERQKGSALGHENSRMYNEMAILKLVQSMTKLLQSPPEVFKTEIYSHFKSRGLALYTRLESLLTETDELIKNQIKSPTTTNQLNADKTIEKTDTNSNKTESTVENDKKKVPVFPLLPASKGFCLSLKSALPVFKEVLKKLELIPSNDKSS